MEGTIGSQADYARHAGISKQAVNKLVKKGTITLREDGKVDFAEADYARKVNADPARQMVNGSSAETTKPEPRTQATTEDGSPTFSEARAERENYQAKIAQLEYQERVGLLLPRREVEDAMVAAGRNIRQALDALVGWADELDAAARNGGVDALRALLREKIRDLETRVVESLSRLASDENEDD